MTKNKGWAGESQKHSMAARKIKTNLKSGYVNYQTKLSNYLLALKVRNL